MNLGKLNYELADAYLVLSEHNRRYFTGFHSSYGVFIATKNQKYYLTDSRYEEACTAHFAKSDVIVRIVSAKEDVFAVYKQIFDENEVKTLGVEEIIDAQTFLKLQEIEGVKTVFSGEYFKQLRAIKTAQEIAKITKIMEISNKAFDKALPFFKVGMTEKEICAEINYQLFNLGADGLAFDTIVASGINGTKPHAVPSDKKIEKGDFITIDFGGKLDGYNADITRTIAVGKISDEQKEAYKTVLKAQKIGLSAIKPNVSRESVDVAVREFFKSQNLDQYFIHSLGHGVGVEIHECPRLAMGEEELLQENMVITCEPGIYIPNKFGIRIEDTVVITKDGYKNLASISKELITIKA